MRWTHLNEKLPSCAAAISALAILSSLSLAVEATQIHRHRAPDGTVVFSDSPYENNTLIRPNYRKLGDTSTARNSCSGLGVEGLAKRQEEWRSAVTRAAHQHGVDPELALAVVRTESCFDPRAISRAGAMGLMQLMPDTARELGVRDAFDAASNLDGGCRYLARMIRRYDGNLSLALAAYNAGPGNVDRYKGIPPFAETERYVERIGRLYREATASR